MRESDDLQAMLRRRLAHLAGNTRRIEAGRIPSGHARLDGALGGGFARGCVHELFAAESDDGTSAAGLAAMLALLISAGGPILWLRTDESARRGGTLHAPGFAGLGGDPATLLIAQAPDVATLLRGAADAARTSGLDALIVECRGRCPALDLTASRRLALAAERSGATLFLLRADADPVPSAAETRWAVAAAPSRALEAGAPGLPALDIELLRRRAGPAGMRWRLEWDRDRQSFLDPALPGAVVSLSSRRPVAPDAERWRRRA
ncbi:ImuA family protein [Sphingomonas xanthus]|uniref:Protein ImuA n=1 Tax=Sphingomonas xanthus TaxID=2594473 RepID=A0A516IS69_9SPHN|nr:hypothetical protein [Sphingomonas xanthus]QDP19709.1 hypothetical protein FMM02_06905 [Sphingomonas xanthus]